MHTEPANTDSVRGSLLLPPFAVFAEMYASACPDVGDDENCCVSILWTLWHTRDFPLPEDPYRISMERFVCDMVQTI